MFYAVRESKSGAILTGEYGSGKTLLSRVLLDELSEGKYKFALVLNPVMSPLELLREIIYQLGGSVSALPSKNDLLHYFNEILCTNKNAGHSVVIIIDEAQALAEESFEELRLLLNFQLNENFLFTLVLLGQPELKDKISNLPQLRQRLPLRYHLTALDESQTVAYIEHRMEVAGAKEEIFNAEAISEVYRFSGGIPRMINNICDMALLIGSGKEIQGIDKALITEVSEDLEEEPVEDNDKERIINNG